MESCVIELTEAAHKYGNLNIRPCGKEFFPPDIFGGSSKKAGLGRPIILRVEGLPEPIKTDIPTDKKTKRPRWMFRERKWVKLFVRYHKLRSDETVRINRINKRIYEVIPENNHGQASPKQRLSKTGDIRKVTREEKRVGIYQTHCNPTKASDVKRSTPLGILNLNWREKDLPERERTRFVHGLHPDFVNFVHHGR